LALSFSGTITEDNTFLDLDYSGCQWDGSFSFFLLVISSVSFATQIQHNKAAVLRCQHILPELSAYSSRSPCDTQTPRQPYTTVV